MEEYNTYESPTIEILELGHEGQIMQMSQIPDYGNGGDPLATMMLP